MSYFQLKFALHYPGERPLKRVFLVRERLEDLSPAFRRMLDALREYMQTRLSTEGTHHGMPRFAPLSARYARTKASLFPGQPILVATGRLRASFAQFTRDSIAVIGRDRLVYGTRVPYAMEHQFGVPARNLPARPPIQLSSRMRAGLVSILRNTMFEGDAGVGEVMKWLRS